MKSIIIANINVKKKIMEVIRIYGYSFLNVYSIRGSIINTYILLRFSSFLHSNIKYWVNSSTILFITIYYFLGKKIINK